jgi:hypothetical protein
MIYQINTYQTPKHVKYVLAKDECACFDYSSRASQKDDHQADHRRSDGTEGKRQYFE